MGGFGSFNLYPPFFSIMAIGASFFTNNEITRLTLGYAISFVLLLSGVSSFIFFKNISSFKVALLCSFLYTLSPYLYGINVFERGALAESSAFIFYPLVLLGFYKLLSQPMQSLYLLVVGFSGLLITNPPAGAVVCIGVIPLLILSLKSLRSLQILVCVGVSTLGLSSFYWIPFLQLYSYNGVDFYQSVNPLFFDLIHYPLDNFQQQVKILILLSFIFTLISPVYWGISRESAPMFYWAVFSSSCICLFFTSSFSSYFWSNFDILDIIQYSFRFIGWITLCCCALLAYIINGYVKHPNCRSLYSILVLMLIALLPYHLYIYHLVVLDHTKREPLVDTNTYKIVQPEHLIKGSPGWNNIADYKEKLFRDSEITSEIPIRRLSVVKQTRTWQVDFQSHKTQIVTTALAYHPLWEVRPLDGTFQGPIRVFPSPQGLLSFYIPEGSHKFEVKFPSQAWEIYSKVISLVFLAVLGILPLAYKFSKLGPKP